MQWIDNWTCAKVSSIHGRTAWRFTVWNVRYLTRTCKTLGKGKQYLTLSLTHTHTCAFIAWASHYTDPSITDTGVAPITNEASNSAWISSVAHTVHTVDVIENHSPKGFHTSVVNAVGALIEIAVNVADTIACPVACFFWCCKKMKAAFVALVK